MPQLRRRALNEAVFREVNEQIGDLASNRGRAQLEIVCECASIGCSFPLQISIEAYEAARGDPTLFIVAPGHNDPAIELVILDQRTYLLVQKVGLAADEARETDPRS